MKHAFATFALATALAFSATGLVACGGDHHDAHHSGEPGEKGEHHEHEGKGPVGDFHAVLGPLWHSDKSPERTAKTCDQAATLHERALAVESAPPADGADADAAKSNAKALTTAVDALIAACAADGRPDVEAKLSDVHDAFHKVAEQGEGKHHHDH